MTFDIHRLWALIFKTFRRKRMKKFLQVIRPLAEETILDVGGTPGTWTPFTQTVQRIDLLNIYPFNIDTQCSETHRMRSILGDGCHMTLENGAYPIVFSNSVIEHVGDWETQQRFARELRRIGGRLWVQTPAYEFFIEPHYLTPFVHWMPVGWRRKLLRNFTVWGWFVRPDQRRVNEMVEEIRLLTLQEIQELFPDCDILVERFLGIFIKSYIAVRT